MKALHHAPQHRRNPGVVQGEQLLVGPLRNAGDAGAFKVLCQEAQPIPLIAVGAIVPLRRGEVEDRLQLVPGIRQIVEAVRHGNVRVGLHNQRRLPGDPVLQPDLLPGRVQSAVARRAPPPVQLNQPRALVGRELQPADSRAGGVGNHRLHQVDVAARDLVPERLGQDALGAASTRFEAGRNDGALRV